ncbi:MAG: L-aspartate oxidase [Methylococcales symbiont of Iophon sp. n. MRB-2018]|nr:MAG: L-aspartate oxidase [Methylococcales symbiont of Iophon sp. n. MRB-2018]KAF3979798.1 MAG: L-aspartate oxidase [Methylococcales symbiont of Iophon sp. n. MRB-2018]
MTEILTYDVLVIGSGCAGLSLASRLADQAQILVLSKVSLSSGSTYHAQGGIAAALDADDSIESHIQDTLTVGAGLCDLDAVMVTVESAKRNIEWLKDQGVKFTEQQADDGTKSLHLNREGGHSHRRIVHAADTTGKTVSQSLIDNVKAHPNITLLENHNAIDLIVNNKSRQRIQGAYLLNTVNNQVKSITAKIVVLATGGASKVYLYSTNPDISTGDGIALAWRAGCQISNMEFMQFHPTCLFHPEERSFLISEAVRGEGGKLILPDGTRFMQKYHPQQELAPRDIVARAIDNEIKKHGIDCVFLDISQQSPKFIQQHFPNIYQRCLALGMDITRQAIPVVPAAHYTCGGVVTNLQAQTNISGLYAIGEVACTGLHGANRMASNSLLECLVFAEIAANNIAQQLPSIPTPDFAPKWDNSLVSESDEEVVVAHNWDELRQFMWDYVGIVRTDKRLSRAMHRLEILKQEIAEYYANFHVTSDLLELRNLVIVAELIIRCAQSRKESRGLHYTKDYPEIDHSKTPENTILNPIRKA